MSEKRLRISIFGLLVAMALASFGCGDGGSGANSAPGGDVISAVMPGTSSASNSKSGNAPDTSTLKTQISHQAVNIANQEEDSPLPPWHGLSEGEIVVWPGKSDKHGNVIFTCPSENEVVCVVHIGADGSVSYEPGWGIPEFTFIPRGGFPGIPLPKTTQAGQAPVLEFDFGSTLHVGAGVAPGVDDLTTGVDRNGVRTSYGEIQDGIGAERVLEFMQQHARHENKLESTGAGGAPGLETFPEPPVIHLAEGTSKLYARYAAHAVQLINNALPYEKRITISAETLPADTALGDLSEGEILLKFGSIELGALGSAGLVSRYRVDPETNEQKVQKAFSAGVTINEKQMRAAYVHNPTPEDPYHWSVELPDSREKNSDKLINLYSDEIFLSVIVHELIHALGLFHIDESRFPNSIMHSKINAERGQVDVYSPYLPENTATILIAVYVAGSDGEETNDQPSSTDMPADEEEEEITVQPVPSGSQGYLITTKARTVPGHILFPIDRAALLAAYGRLQPGAQPEDLTAENLGAWSDTSFHLRGSVDYEGGEAAFGVASANGFTQPWATGSTPWTKLKNNQALSGRATWNGALLGVDSASETVAGDTHLTVNLNNLNGRINFTNMEKWGAGEAPGEAGSGATWGDGDLGYNIRVRGNTFTQTGGDDGHVTGAFFGTAHEAMGGVLERADLSAGFGGKR